MSKERLTNETLDNVIKAQKIGAETVLEKMTVQFLEELKEYENLKEQGLLLRLPCKRVWFVCDAGTEYATVMSKSIYDLDLNQIEEVDVKGHYFSTQAEAEEKLRELKGEQMVKGITGSYFKHPNGYSAILYGESSMIVYFNGEEVLHTGSRRVNTKEEVMKLLEEMPKFLQALQEVD